MPKYDTKHFEYLEAQRLRREATSVNALLMAILMKADLAYAEPIKKAFPSVTKELAMRICSPNGRLKGE